MDPDVRASKSTKLVGRALERFVKDTLDTVVVLEFDTSLNNIPTIKTSFQNIDQGDPKTHDLK